MHIVHILIHVKNDKIEEFKNASLENAKNSLKEPGIARFDLIQQKDDPTRFLLLEVYRTPKDVVRHKETAHYKRWQETVEPWMQEARTRIIYQNIFPDESGWS